MNGLPEFDFDAEFVMSGIPDRFCVTSRPIKTRLATLDILIDGLFPGTVTVIGSKVSVGKSSLAQQIAFSAAMDGFSALFVTSEMDHKSFIARRCATLSHVSNHILRGGHTSPGQLDFEMEMIAENPVEFILADSKLDADAFKKLAASFHERRGLDLVVVDPVGAIWNGTNASRCDSMDRTMDYIRAIANEIGCAAVATVHLRADADSVRPRISDIPGSGAVVDVADNVWLIARPMMSREAALFIDKSRQSFTDKVLLHYEDKFLQFDDDPETMREER